MRIPLLVIHELLLGCSKNSLDLNIREDVPDCNTIWIFRESLMKAGVYEKLFEKFNKELEKQNLIANKGSIVEIIGLISGLNINITVPKDVDVTNLIASFNSTGKTVKINSVLQISGLTMNDFTNTLVYSVLADDGSINYYNVFITNPFYVIGSVYNSSNILIPCYWKNGIKTELSTLSSHGGYTFSGFINSSDVYIVGYTCDSSGNYGLKIPCYWKNDIRTDLYTANSTTDNIAYSILVNNGSVYVVGELDLKPCYWVNNVPYNLSLPQSNWWGGATSIFISGSDIYISGTNNYGYSNYTPCFWKNGVRTDLPVLSSNGGYASGISVINGNIYVIGMTYDSAKKSIPCYWVDGVRTDLISSGSLSSH